MSLRDTNELMCGSYSHQAGMYRAYRFQFSALMKGIEQKSYIIRRAGQTERIMNMAVGKLARFEAKV